MNPPQLFTGIKTIIECLNMQMHHDVMVTLGEFGGQQKDPSMCIVCPSKRLEMNRCFDNTSGLSCHCAAS